MPTGDPGLSTKGFVERFEGEQLGELWHKTGGNYRVSNGQLFVKGARNKPLWLRRSLPHDVRVEFDVRSESPSGDIKVELFGDGRSYAKTLSYTATGYVIIFGGWNNSKDVIARMDEHGADRIEKPTQRVVPGKTYHMLIERRGKTLEASLDGKPWLKLVDSEPLSGRGHDHFAFNDWDAELYFDNLKIQPL